MSKIFLAAFLSFNVFAQSATSLENTSETNLSGFSLEKVAPDRISYFGDMAGPSLETSANAADGETGEIVENSLSLWNQVSFQWKINDNYRFTVNPRWIQNFNPGPDDRNFEYDSPVVGIAGTYYQNGDFSFGGAINTITPMTRDRGHQEIDLLYNPGGFQWVNYKIDDRWTAGLWLWGRFYVYEGEAPLTEELADYLWAPIATYAVNDSVSVSTFYQYTGERFLNGDAVNHKDDSLNVMFSAKVGNVTIQPILRAFRATSFNLADANLNMWISAQLF